MVGSQNSSGPQRRRFVPWLITGTGVERNIGDVQALIEEKYKSDDYISKRFLSRLRLYDEHGHRDTFIYALVQWILIPFSALTTLFIGLQSIVTDGVAIAVFKACALSASVLVAIMGLVLRVGNFQATSVSNHEMRERLLAEFYKFDQCIGAYKASNTSERDTKLFAENVEALIQYGNGHLPLTSSKENARDEADRGTSDSAR